MSKKLQDWQRDKAAGRKRALVTAYDYPFAHFAAQAGLDGILVGDSLGMVVAGEADTLGVGLEQLCYHTRMAARGAANCLLIADLPFGSYEASPEQAWSSAVALLRAGADMIKLEGGQEMAETVAFLAQRGIAVSGHIGLTPQRVRQWGGFRRQGTNAEGAQRLREDAAALAAAGARLLVIEAVPAELGAEITRNLAIPTIGIGAGPDTDAQVLVLHDVLGLAPGGSPAFAHQYLAGAGLVEDALTRYAEEVRSGRFPPRQEH